MTTIFREPPTPTPHKMAEAELAFADEDGMLSGLSLRGFEFWEPAHGAADVTITFPTRHFIGRDGKVHPYPLLYSPRPNPDATAALRRFLAAGYHLYRQQLRTSR